MRDIDVATHIPGGGLRDILRVGRELEERLGVPADVVPLGEIPPRLRLKVLLEGMPLIIRRRAAYTELLKETASEIEDMKIKHA